MQQSHKHKPILVQAQLEKAQAQNELANIMSGKGQAYQQIRELVAQALAEASASKQNQPPQQVTNL